MVSNEQMVIYLEKSVQIIGSPDVALYLPYQGHGSANSVTVEPTLALRLKDIASHLLSCTAIATRVAVHKRYSR